MLEKHCLDRYDIMIAMIAIVLLLLSIYLFDKILTWMGI